jgi:hypothetical protein
VGTGKLEYNSKTNVLKLKKNTNKEIREWAKEFWGKYKDALIVLSEKDTINDIYDLRILSSIYVPNFDIEYDINKDKTWKKYNEIKCIFDKEDLKCINDFMNSFNEESKNIGYKNETRKNEYKKYLPNIKDRFQNIKEKINRSNIDEIEKAYLIGIINDIYCQISMGEKALFDDLF